MRTLATVAIALFFLAIPLGAFADTLEPEDQWVTFDGGHWTHEHGVRMSYMLLDFDNGQLNRLYFRLTPLRGGITVDDVTIESKGEIIYRHSDKNKMGFSLHFYNTPMKHYEQRIFFAPPLDGFDKATGKIKWYYTAGAEKYLVTWSAADNTFAINILKD